MTTYGANLAKAALVTNAVATASSMGAGAAANWVLSPFLFTIPQTEIANFGT